MNLELPADARVQIFITTGNALALPDPAQFTSIAAPTAPVRPRRLLLKGTAGLLLLVGTYTLGNRAGLHANPPLVTGAQASAQEQRGLAPQKPGEVPPQFAQQLQQPPVVTPPPGAGPGNGAPTKGGFGLED